MNSLTETSPVFYFIFRDPGACFPLCASSSANRWCEEPSSQGPTLPENGFTLSGNTKEVPKSSLV